MRPPPAFPLPTLDELAAVAAQLGRRPTGVVGIAARCPAGHPAVVVSHPLQRVRDRLTPFPTLYWLTCPELCRAVSRLEMGGLIAVLDRRLGEDEALAAALLRNHDEYIAARWALLEDVARLAVDAGGLRDVLLRRGIGGLRHRRSVKCLHLHLAHELAAGNAIGAIVMAEHGVAPCRRE